MKKLLLLSIVVLLPLLANAYDFAIGDLCYTITSTEERTVSVEAASENLEGEVVIPSTVTYNGVEFTVTRIADNGFAKCFYITTLTIPGTINNINAYGLAWLLGLKTLIIDNPQPMFIAPTGVNYDWRAFETVKLVNSNEREIIEKLNYLNFLPLHELYINGNLVENYKVPDGTTTIGQFFSNCSTLKTIEMPYTVERINSRAFWNCKALSSVTLSAWLEKIDAEAFFDCPELRTIYVKSSIPPSIFENSFPKGAYMFAKVYIPKGTLSLYENAPNWSQFANFIEAEYDGDNSDEYSTEYVNLGLPSGVLWATKNVGANNPEEVGDYFAWGETSPKDEYKWSTYKHVISKETYLTKYCNSYGGYGNVDNKETLDPEDDAATVNLGNSWRTPTLSEMQELREYCKWQHVTLNGVNGYTVISPNGRAIFIPSGGMMQSEKLVSREDVFLMSSTYDYDDNLNACIFSIIHDIPEFDYLWRAWGYNVRPVVNTTPTKIVGLSAGNTPQIIGIYNLHGQKLNGYQKGINIVKYSDGTSKKIVK